MNLTAVEGEANFRRAFVTGNQWDGQPDSRHDNLGDVIGRSAGSDGAKLERRLGSEPLLHAGNAGRFGDPDRRVVLCWDPQVLKFPRIKLDSYLSQNLLQNQTADEMAD